MLTDVARTDVLTAAPDTTVAEAVAAMRAHDRPLVVVLDEQRPLGLVSAADVGLAVDTVADLPSAAVVDVADEVVTIRERASRAGLLSRFRETDADRLVVVDDGEEFVGVVSRWDLVGTYAEELDALLALF